MQAEYMLNHFFYELSDLEKRTILTLAEKGPMSGYDFHLAGKRRRGNREALMSSSSWNKIKEHLAQNLKLIEPIEQRGLHSNDQRGRRRDLYWLTDQGSMYALVHDVSPARMLYWTRKLKPERIEFIAFMEIIQVAQWTTQDVSKFWVLYKAIKEKKFDLALVLFTYLQNKTALTDKKKMRKSLKKLAKVVKRHPKVFNLKTMTEMKEATSMAVEELFRELSV